MPSSLGTVASHYSVGEIPIPSPPVPPAPVPGSVIGLVSWAGSVTGKRVPKGAVPGVITWFGTVTGETPSGFSEGHVSGAITRVGTVTGLRTSRGQVFGVVSWVGTVAGQVTEVPAEYASVATVSSKFSPASPSTPLGTNHVMPMPDDIEVGDLIISWITAQDGGSTALSCKSTYDLIYARSLSGNQAKHALCARIADGTSDDELEWSGSSTAFACSVLRIVDHGLSDASTLKFAATETTTNGVPNPPLLDALVSLKHLWLVYGGIWNSDPEEIDAVGTSYTEVSSVWSTQAADNVSQLIGSRELESNSHNPAAYTNDLSTDWMAATVAIQPAS